MTRLLTENLGWKIAAFAIATGLWYGFVGETELATSVPLAVQFKNVPPGLEFTSEQLDRVFLRLRGPATRLNPTDLPSAVVVFDLAQIDTPGEHTFFLGPNTLQLPPGVRLVGVIPSQVRLMFEKRASREVPVEVRYAGPPPLGYRVKGQRASPQNVRIAGSESRVQAIESAQTDPIDLSSTVSNSDFRVPAFIADPRVHFESAPPVISVRVFMEKVPQ